MGRRIAGLSLALLLLAVLAYLSRFWIFSWWGREGLFGLPALRPGGDLWRRWMNDLDLGPYDVVLWGAAAFVFLSLVQRLWDRLAGGGG